MAKEMGKENEYKTYSERALRYKKYFDPVTGFMRGVMSTGEWRTPFNPRYSDHTYADYVEEMPGNGPGLCLMIRWGL
jgi:putative alpha-1,2-mannosidase